MKWSIMQKLKSNFCDNNDAYILVRGAITIEGRNIATEVAFKNCTILLNLSQKLTKKQ